MTEPVAYRVNGTIYDDIKDAEFAVREIEHLRNTLKIDNGLIRKLVYIEPLYTSDQLHPLVKMTQAEFDEFKKLLSVGISTIYEAFDVIDSDRGEMDEFEQLYNRLFTNTVNEQAKKQMEFSKLWDSLSNSSAEETIEIVPKTKWFVRVDSQIPLPDEKIYLDNELIVYPHYDSPKSSAHQFDTKEEAERWTNPLTEAVQLPVEDK